MTVFKICIKSLLLIFFFNHSEIALDPQTPVCNWETHTWRWGTEGNEVLLHVGLVNSVFFQVLGWQGKAVHQGCWGVTDPQFPTVCCRDINFLHTVCLPQCNYCNYLIILQCLLQLVLYTEVHTQIHKCECVSTQHCFFLMSLSNMPIKSENMVKLEECICWE